ncbi:M15 family metallopeptidase [Haliangium sp.]|uniref:M15 family metallopeptidase n=1 Tax=Haliangium sp. TaxID=2663208 RepID=UPI003D13925E
MSERLDATVEPIGPELHAEMRGASWHPHPACPAPSELALVRMNHWDFDHRVRRGELVVAAAVADELVRAFEMLFAARFPIARMVRIDAYGGDDEASMAANNCSAFNFRVIAGTDRLSHHALGLAVDINPVQNPWCRGDEVQPPAGRAFIARDPARPGAIVRPGPVTDAFDAIGWHWGGDWDDTKDYHHFAKQPR